MLLLARVMGELELLPAANVIVLPAGSDINV
jgi:hypothetical protein